MKHNESTRKCIKKIGYNEAKKVAIVSEVFSCKTVSGYTQTHLRVYEIREDQKKSFENYVCIFREHKKKNPKLSKVSAMGVESNPYLLKNASNFW